MSSMVSIVTPSYQQGEFIEDAVRSVQLQDHPEVEQWVIDGGSTDGTLDALRGLSEEFPDRLRWVSEPDGGQSDAINKGFRKARGEIVAWLNADDVYFPRVLSRVVEVFAKNPDVDVVYGKGLFLNREGAYSTEFPHNRPFDADRLLAGDAFLLQPTVFWRRSLFERVGRLAEDLHYSMDYDLWCRMAKAGVRFLYDPDRYYAAARYYRETKTTSGRWKRSRELTRVARRHSRRLLPMITFYSWLEALMSTSFMAALYRPYKRLTSGLDIEYWDIPAPEARGAFEVRFPWWKPACSLRLDIGLRSSPPPDCRLDVCMDGRLVKTVSLAERRSTIDLPCTAPDNEIRFGLTVHPAGVRYRVRKLQVRLSPA